MAALWPAVPAAWPCCAIGTRAATATHGHEDQRGVVAHGEAQHGDEGADERRREPGLAERDRREELAEGGTEAIVEGERRVGDREEGEEAGGAGGDGEDAGGCRRDVERPVELVLIGAQRPAHEHERADHAGGTEVHEQLRGRAVPSARRRPDPRGPAVPLPRRRRGPRRGRPAPPPRARRGRALGRIASPDKSTFQLRPICRLRPPRSGRPKRSRRASTAGFARASASGGRVNDARGPAEAEPLAGGGAKTTWQQP